MNIYLTNFEEAVCIVFILPNPKVPSVRVRVYGNKNYNMVKLRKPSYKLGDIRVPLGYGLVVANVERHTINAKLFIAIIIFL